MKRTILHVDMNNFYASVECSLHPELRGKPIAVGGSAEERHGIILAKNEAAKAKGVKTGEALWQATAKCRDLVIVPPTFEAYMRYSSLARRMYRDYTDQIEPFGLDECWLDVSGSGILGSGEELAHEIRKLVTRELGLTVSVGVSFNKVFAKLGSDMKKPDAVTVIPQESFREKIWGLPATDLLGVGRATGKRLSALGIHTIGQLALLPEAYLVTMFGKSGSCLWRYANGLDRSPVLRADDIVPAKSVGHGTTTPTDLTDADGVWRTMLALVQDIGHKLKVCGQYAQGVEVAVRDNALGWKMWQCQLSVPTDSALTLARTAYALFCSSYQWERPLRSVTVRAIRLTTSRAGTQIRLWDDTASAERREKLENTVEAIRGRFGRSALLPATLLGDGATDAQLEPAIVTLPGRSFA